jgi:hypothetical protein
MKMSKRDNVYFRAYRSEFKEQFPNCTEVSFEDLHKFFETDGDRKKLYGRIWQFNKSPGRDKDDSDWLQINRGKNTVSVITPPRSKELSQRLSRFGLDALRALRNTFDENDKEKLDSLITTLDTATIAFEADDGGDFFIIIAKDSSDWLARHEKDNELAEAREEIDRLNGLIEKAGVALNLLPDKKPKQEE